MLQFFETVMGKRFFEGTVPRIADALEERNKILKEQNALLRDQNKLRESQLEALEKIAETIKWYR